MSKAVILLQVSILFEVEDLSQASPATVSRAGMIYLNVEDLGWRPFIASWLQQKQVRTLSWADLWCLAQRQNHSVRLIAAALPAHTVLPCRCKASSAM